MSSCCCKCKCQGFVSQIWRKNICLDCFHSKEAHNGIKFDEFNPPKNTIKKKKKINEENVNRSNEEPIMKLIFDTNDSNENNQKGSRRKRRTLDLESPKSVEEIAENLRKETQLRVNKEVEVNKAINAFKDFTSMLKNTLKDKSPSVIGFVIQEYEKQFDLYVTGNIEKIDQIPQQEIERLQKIEEQRIIEEKERKRKEKEKKKLQQQNQTKINKQFDEEDSKIEKSKEDSSINKSNEDDDSQMNDSKEEIQENNNNYKNNNNINNKNRDQSPNMTEEEENKLKMTIHAMMKKKKISKKKDENKKKEPKQVIEVEETDNSSLDELKNLIGNTELVLDPQEQSSDNENDSKKMISEESNLQDLLVGQNILDKLNLNENESDEESEKQESEKKELDNDSEDSLISSSPAITPNSSLTSNVPKEKQRPSVLKYFSYGKRKENVPHKSLLGLFAPPPNNNEKQDQPPRKVLKTNETSSPSASVDDSESLDSESTSLKKLLIKSTTEIPPELKISSTEDLLSKLDSEFVEINSLEDQSLLIFESNQVICQYGVTENLNKAGLKRAKKTELNVRGKPLYEMQDFHFCEFPFKENKFLGIFAIFDGHAGALCAGDAIKYLPEVFSELWEKKYSNCNEIEKADNEELLTQTFVNLDKKLEPHLYQGCTATISIIWSVGDSRYLQVGNVGDSRAYLCRNKSVICLTEDHKLSNPNERKRVLEMGVILAPKADRIHGLAVTRALGDIFLKQEKQGLTEIPHLTKPIQIRNDDKFLIIASDGLWDIMDGDQAYRLIKDMNDSKEMANLLIKTALKSRDCNDNITVCVVILN